MYKTIKIDDINTKVPDGIFKNYKLCYIGKIPETSYDYTPDAKLYRETEEWKEQAELRLKKIVNNGGMLFDDPEFGINNNPIIRRGEQIMECPHPDYEANKQELYAYFTPIELHNQGGAEWNGAPYEHYSSEPSDLVADEVANTEYANVKTVTKYHEIDIIRIPFYFPYGTVYYPKDWNTDGNSPFCVNDINAGAVAWIFYRGNYAKNEGISIMAGCSPYEFKKKVEQIKEKINGLGNLLDN